MDRMEFLERWQLISEGTIPLPHVLKHSLPERWFRIHSLPASKRYAGNDAEWEILLQRQNALASRVFPPDATVYFVVLEYYPDEVPMHDFGSLQAIALEPLVQIDLHAYAPDEYLPEMYCALHFAQTHWESGKFDLVLRDIARDDLTAFWVSFETGVIFAPYDGGVDVIMPSTQARNAMRVVYKDWLSPRVDGM